MTKPTVFNYKNHEELRQAYKELLADNQQLIADNRKLRKEVGELKQLNDGYVKIIAKNQETNNKLMASVQKQTGGDYISRADAICEVLVNDGIDNIVDRINALPSADADVYEDYEHATLVDIKEPLKVSVVRCKDCIHWKADNEVFELGFCCVFPQKWVAETFYCADGERREK